MRAVENLVLRDLGVRSESRVVCLLLLDEAEDGLLCRRGAVNLIPRKDSHGGVRILNHLELIIVRTSHMGAHTA